MSNFVKTKTAKKRNITESDNSAHFNNSFSANFQKRCFLQSAWGIKNSESISKIKIKNKKENAYINIDSTSSEDDNSNINSAIVESISSDSNQEEFHNANNYQILNKEPFNGGDTIIEDDEARVFNSLNFNLADHLKPSNSNTGRNTYSMTKGTFQSTDQVEMGMRRSSLNDTIEVDGVFGDDLQPPLPRIDNKRLKVNGYARALNTVINRLESDAVLSNYISKQHSDGAGLMICEEKKELKLFIIKITCKFGFYYLWTKKFDSEENTKIIVIISKKQMGSIGVSMVVSITGQWHSIQINGMEMLYGIRNISVLPELKRPRNLKIESNHIVVSVSCKCLTSKNIKLTK